MSHANLQNKLASSRNLIDFFSIGSVLLGSGLIFTVYRPVGFLGLGGGMAAFIVSNKTRHTDVLVMEDYAKKLEIDYGLKLQEKTKLALELETEHQTLTTRFKELTDKNNQLAKTGESLQYLLDKKEAEKLELRSEVQVLSGELGKEIDELKQELTRIRKFEADVIFEAKRCVRNSLDVWCEKLIDKIQSMCEKIPELAEKLQKIVDDMNYLNPYYIKEIESCSDEIEDFPTLLSLIHEINVDFSQRKEKFINIMKSYYLYQRRDEINRLKDELDEWESQELVPKDKVIELQNNFKVRLQEFIGVKNATVEDFKLRIQQLKEECSDDEFFGRLQSIIAQLEEKVMRYELEINRLSKPHTFPGTSEQARVGNELVMRYGRSGFVLDAVDWNETDTGYRLLFHLGRNQSFISVEKLNENHASEFIKSLASAINSPEFKRSERGGYIYLDIQKFHKQKTANDVIRLLTDLVKLSNEIIDGLSQKPTIRIMGATGEGKGIVARYLINSILSNHNWYLRLHDPQHGSDQDHWGIPKVSRTGEEMKTALVNIEKQMIQRETDKNWSIVTLDVLDEIDTQLEQAEKKESFIELVSRMRHCGMKLILLGQNPKVGRAGFQWADMQQMTCIYMGASADDAIESNPYLKGRKEKLGKQYLELSEYFEEANKYLEDYQKYYFGLVVMPGKTPKWFVLPRADEIEIEVNELLLGKIFSIPDSLLEIVEYKNLAKASGNSAITNRNSIPSASAESLINQGMPEIADTSDYVGVAGTIGKSGNSGKATCKKHPDAELRPHKDGRHYCPSCKKRLPKSDIEFKEI